MNNQPDKFDAAMARRLAQLGAMPVDTSRLEKAVRAEMGAPAGATSNLVWRRKTFRSLAAVAASLILVALVGLAFLQNRPVLASSDMMLQLHRDIIAGKITVMPVDSVDDVNHAFATFGNGGMKIEAPQIHVMSCCLKNVGSRQVYCVQLNEDKVPVTLTIADMNAVAPMEGPAVMHGGEAFHVTTSGTLNMVTVDRAGEHGKYRVCLIGELAADKLMTLTDGLKL